MLLNTSAQCPTAQPILLRKIISQSPVPPIPEPIRIYTDYSFAFSERQPAPKAAPQPQIENSLQRSAQQLIQFKKNQTNFLSRLDLR